ncbi:MAG: CBS domain-containing protein [Desulfobacteraceae bacterium]|nr:CBS domain-containing protein [Desulfobacteraceae bacterium]
MKEKKIEEILLPLQGDVPLHPSLSLGDKIIHAIEFMVNNNLKCIAVVRDNRPIGMVCLKDAFQKLGLKMSDIN